MANLNDKFDVIKGWEPGGDASIDQSFPIAYDGGAPVTLLPGYIVTVDAADGTVDVATTPASVALGTANPLQVYVVVEGNAHDTAPQFLEKVVCLRGKLTVKTDKLDSGQTFPVAGGVTFTNGLLQDKAGNANTQLIGTVIENNVAVDGTIVVELDL
jgi:hypothetical protein